jgi:hypothetical protein
LIAASTGLHVLDEVEHVDRARRIPSAAPGIGSSVISAPATNDLSPAPVRITARTASPFSSSGFAQFADYLGIERVETLGRLMDNGHRAVSLEKKIVKTHRARSA